MLELEINSRVFLRKMLGTLYGLLGTLFLWYRDPIYISSDPIWVPKKTFYSINLSLTAVINKQVETNIIILMWKI